MNKELIEAEQRVQQLKHADLEARWKQWMDDTEAYLDKMVGKTFLSSNSRNNVTIFRVSGYKKCGYLDVKGIHWYEVETEGYYNLSHTDPYGRYGRCSFDQLYSNDVDCPYNTFRVVSDKRRPVSKIVSKIDVRLGSLNRSVLYNDVRMVTIGRYASAKPNDKDYQEQKYFYDGPPANAYRYFGIYLTIAPEGLFEECKELADMMRDKTVSILEKYNVPIQNSERFKG